MRGARFARRHSLQGWPRTRGSRRPARPAGPSRITRPGATAATDTLSAPLPAAGAAQPLLVSASVAVAWINPLGVPDYRGESPPSVGMVAHPALVVLWRGNRAGRAIPRVSGWGSRRGRAVTSFTPSPSCTAMSGWNSSTARTGGRAW